MSTNNFLKSKIKKTDFIKVKKKNYNVQVYKPPHGTKIYNFLEDSIDYTDETKPYVIIGILGEEWTMNENKLKQIYNVNINDITEDPIVISTKTDENSPKNYCIHIPLDIKFEILTLFKNILKVNRDSVPHNNGDYLFCTSDINGNPNINDKWVVNGMVFDKTYEKISAE